MNCDHKKTKVYDSRNREGVILKYRRHECVECGHRFSSVEVKLPDSGNHDLQSLDVRFERFIKNLYFKAENENE